MWINNEGVLKYSNIEPTAEEIYSHVFDGLQIIQNCNILQDISSCFKLRFSKIGMQPQFFVKYKENQIFIVVSVTKNNQVYEVKKNKNFFLDYIIINDVWYYLSDQINLFKEIIDFLKIDVNKSISYKQYMDLARMCAEKQIALLDDFSNDIKTENSILCDEEDLNLKANLFTYQKVGKKWLSFMVENRCGCILADDMGLGKTLQIIATIGQAKSTHGHVISLIVAPVSLLENWRREIEKFYPSLKVLVHHGSGRTGLYSELLNYNVVITSYTNTQSDLSMLNMIEWDLVVLDEAQNIKNPYAERSKLIKQINKKTAIAVTGTPFENHMTDIWSIVDFIMPGYLGGLTEYQRNYQDDVESAVTLEKLLSPIMLRRKVDEVAKDLPDRVDISQAVLMDDQEASLYESQRVEVVNAYKLKQVSIDKIQGLRMFCTHPMVYDKSIRCQDPSMISRKYSRLCEIVEEIVSKKEKAIIFTSFNNMIDIIKIDFSNRFGVYTNIINGATPIQERQNIIDEFTLLNGAGILILNPKAAGVGLNITAANHVIHYNLEWNPAVEDQASARAYRRGQKKTVFVHRLYYSNTIEEIINERIETKRNLSDKLVIGTDGNINHDDLLKALAISPCGGKNEQ